jgi:hypothetical protein
MGGCDHGRPGASVPDGGGLILGDPKNEDPMMSDPSPSPSSSPEVCGNGADDDGNGFIDDGCACALGETQPCYTGPGGARGVGACTEGTITCHGDAEFASWSGCVGDVQPQSELCDNAGVDENCNGAVNEGCQCAPGDPPVACGTDEGECVAGTQTCDNGSLGPCIGAVGPAPEGCNDKDDDCDGLIDEGLSQNCGTDVGECVKGTQTCSAGKWGDCSGVGPALEICDGKDNNCDGRTDEGCACTDGTMQPCGTDKGECEFGTQTCSGGTWGSCLGGVTAVPEVCNNKDDDCDGKIDDGVNRPCGSDVGECVAGTEKCTGGMWGSCTGVGPVMEICGNGKDDDCDMQTDEMCSTTKLPPVATCGATINTTPLATVTLSGSGSDPDGGGVTYRWTVTSAPAGSASMPNSPNSASTTFFVDLAGSYTLTLTVTDDEGQTATCTITINAVPTQDLHVELVWNTAWGDVDLHLTQAGVAPASAWYMSPTMGEAACWFGNPSASWPAGGAAGDATLDIDDKDGFGPENINISNTPSAGTYEIGVAFYCSHSVARNPGDRVNPGDGPTSATVKVYCGGSLVATYGNISLTKTGQFVDVASVTWPGCAGQSKMNSSWTANIQPAYYANPIHCPVLCTKDSDCTSGESCANGNPRLCVLN